MPASSDALSARLSRIDTSWPVLRQVHDGSPAARQQAVAELQRCYGLAVRRYLRGIVQKEEEAEELSQRFWLRLLEGRYRGAKPEKGKFRYYLKSCLHTLVMDLRRERKMIQLNMDDGQEPATPMKKLTTAEEDAEFTEAWRQALLAGALLALAHEERRDNRGLYVVLKAHLELPKATSKELAAKISAGGKTVTDVWVRKKLMQARGRFAELLLDDVARSLEQPSLEAITEELIDVGLWEYCRDYVVATAD